MQPQQTEQPPTRPLCVDLDGTLVRSDLLAESVFALLKGNILYLFLLPLWVLKGKAYLKQQIAERVDLDVSLLPYHPSFLEFLTQQHAAGRRLILATASNVKFAEAVAFHLGLFHDVLASDAATNLSGRRKLERLQSTFGECGFDYAGNAMVDVAIWQHAAEAVVVNPGPGVLQAAGRVARVARVFEDRSDSVRHYLRAVRLHQWLKNLLVFVPLLLAHKIHEPLLLAQAGLAFFAFGLCASSVYLLNDLLDLPADRQHPTKRRRPFAAGNLSILRGAASIPLLLAAAFGVALLLPLEFAGMLALYYLVTLSYSFYFKQSPLVDVLVLAGLYTLRLIAGGAAVAIELSFWLLAFSMFLFLSLALVKRFTELILMNNSGQEIAVGRGYRQVDLETLAHFGSASGYMAVLVLALYINSEDVTVLYSHPPLIWLLCPLFLYLISRIWLLARRGELHEDPVIFVIRDHRSLLVVGLAAILLWAAS